VAVILCSANPAYEDVVANDAVTGVNVIDVAADAVSANDAVTGVNVIDVAADAVFAKDAEIAVPIEPENDAVIDDAMILYPVASIVPLTSKDPVIFAPPDWAIIPRRATNSFAIGFLQNDAKYLIYK
jgi:hypothetical protein